MNFKKEYQAALIKVVITWLFSRLFLFAVFTILSGKVSLALLAWLGWELYQWLNQVFQDNKRAAKIFKGHLNG